jgi:hypothetical protein
LSISTRLLAATWSRRFFRSRSGPERAKAARVSSLRRVAATDFCRARLTAASSFCRAIGFSRKSWAPMRVASTAVSMVPWPDIITTGMLSWPAADHSLRSVMPSVSGIQMSSSTRSGRAWLRAARAAAAFSASCTSWPSSRRISESSSRMPTSSSTTSIFAIAFRFYAAKGSLILTCAPRGAALAISIWP